MQETKMNSALCISSLFLASYLILFCAESAANDIVKDTFKKIAASTPNVKYNYCMKSLGSDPKSRTADIQGLGLIALNLLENSLTGTRPYIQQLLKQKWNRYVKNCLLDCSDLYSDSVETMKDAVRSYRAKRYSDAQFSVGVVATDVDTCGSQFREKKGVVSPLTKQNKDTAQLSYIGLAIIATVRGSWKTVE